MKVKYFYDPRVGKTEDGEYCVNIYKHKRKGSTLVKVLSNESYDRLMTNVHIYIDTINYVYSKNII